VSKYVEFPLDGGGSIVIESAEEPMRTGTGFLRGEGGYTAANTATQSFDASVEAVRQSADLLVSKLRGLSTPPDELTVAFALKASGELGGLAVAKNGGDANFNVTLKWSKYLKPDDAHAPAAQSGGAPVGYSAPRQLPAEPAMPEPDRDEPDTDDQLAA
jgi:hypothetical protein